MLISVIVPVYNVAQYLQGCVDSILANDCAACEIILVDDGSTDGVCPQLCDEIAADHGDLIRVIHQQNKGLGGARNTGIEEAKGDYLLFVDSDDTIAPETLTVLKQNIAKTHADIYSFNLYFHDGEGKKQRIRVAPTHEDVFSLAEQPQFLFSLPAAWARLWKRNLFVNASVRYPERAWYEDIRTGTKLFAAANSIVALPDTLYYYLARQGSIMRSGDLERNREIFDAFDDILQWYTSHGLGQQYRHELCRLAVDHIQLAAVVRVIRQGGTSGQISEYINYMNKNFGGWEKNPYLAQLPGKHKLLLRLMAKKRYGLIRVMFRFMGSK